MKRNFKEKEIQTKWSNNKTVIIDNKKYRVGKMSYGEYFLEPISWKGGEKDGHSPDTIWLDHDFKNKKFVIPKYYVSSQRERGKLKKVM